MRRHRQSGQAVIEGLIVLGVLSGFWLSVAWIGRLQDVALQVGHASRHQAFAFAHQGQMRDTLAVEDLPGQSWQTRRGEPLLDAGAGRLSFVLDDRSPGAQPGEAGGAVTAARQDLQLGDNGIWVVDVHRETVGESRADTSLRNFDRLRLGIDRHTAIMRGTGAAASDGAVQARLAEADSIWADQARRSMDLGEQVFGRMQAVDAAWGRPDLRTDWLAPWAGWVPGHHLRTGGVP